MRRPEGHTGRFADRGKPIGVLDWFLDTEALTGCGLPQ
jgi:hypothetical protein